MSEEFLGKQFSAMHIHENKCLHCVSSAQALNALNPLRFFLCALGNDKYLNEPHSLEQTPKKCRDVLNVLKKFRACLDIKDLFAILIRKKVQT